jgi:hypothetical protein
MNISSPALRRSLLALGLSAGLALICTPALANHVGSGGSHSVGHTGGTHFSGASRGYAGSRGAVMRGGAPAHFSGATGRVYGGGFGVAGRGYAGYGGYRGYGGGYWHGGGYWRGGLWYGGFLAALPLYYDMFWWGGVPYYYANDAYYVWSDSANGYTSVPPPGDQPPAAAQADQGPAAAQADQGPAAANSDLIVYPKNGQSPDQQARDRYECGHWAATQSGFNPAQPGQSGAVPAAGSDQYLRAESACLEGRGYTVK